MKKLLIIIMLFSALILAAEPIDINKASLRELQQLPITQAQAQAIYNYRHYISFFSSIYDLREVEGIDQKTLLKLKPLIIVSHYDDLDETAQRREEIYYILQRLGNSEGMQEGMSDIWEDYLITPRNVNHMTFRNLLNMPNVSTIDAYAIRQRITRGDSIADYRDLRHTEGISYYGASNLRHYIYYKDSPSEKDRIYFDYQLKYDDSPYMEDPETMFKESMINLLPQGDDQSECPRIKKQSYWGYFNMDTYSPSVLNKMRLRQGNDFKAGFMYNSNKGENEYSKTGAEDMIQNGKFFLDFERFFSNNNYLKMVFGNYQATYGQGLVMENTDFYSARKTGYGFSKRITGIIPDLSRSQEYNLRGAALEFSNHNLYASLFISSDKKDAVAYDSNHDGVINEDDQQVFSYITMSHRFDNNDLEDAENYFNNYNEPGFSNPYTVQMAPRKDWLQEDIIGGHLSISPVNGTNIGFTAYEAVYDKEFVVDADSLKNYLFRANQDAVDKWKDPDSEILAMYSTRTDKYNRDYRRVFGLDWRTVYGNTSLEGEYAELQVDGKEAVLGDDPSALVLSAYSQWDNLYFLTLYRDYDLDFDNPYARAFSEHQKFDGTVLDNYAYTTTNSLLNDLYSNNAQAQAEQGVYFETRYRFHEKLTLTRAYIDIWQRKCDMRKSVRFQGELDFRPFYQLSFRLKHKHQQNRYDDFAERAVSITNETTMRIISFLSARNYLSLEYRYLSVWGPPYPYLSNDAAAGGNSSVQASTLSYADYLAVDYTHNFNEGLKMQGAFVLWNGNGLSHWDWEDIEIDFFGEEGFKFWFALQDRISNNLYLSLKYKYKKFNTREYEYRAWWNEAPEAPQPWVYNRVKKEVNTIRLQLDYKF